MTEKHYGDVFLASHGVLPDWRAFRPSNRDQPENTCRVCEAEVYPVELHLCSACYRRASYHRDLDVAHQHYSLAGWISQQKHRLSGLRYWEGTAEIDL